MGRTNPVHYLKTKKRSNVDKAYGFRWCKSNHSAEFKIISKSPLVAKGYPLSGPKFIENMKMKFSLGQEKNGLRGSAVRLTFIIKYRYCTDVSRCERAVTG